MSLDLPPSPLGRIASFCLNAGRAQILAVAGAMICLNAVADWAVGLDISLGILYILPMVLAAVVLPPVPILAMALVCATLRSIFDNPHSKLEIGLRFAFATLAYAGAGLFVMTVIRSRKEHMLRVQAEEQLSVLVDSSPAGILTLDAAGVVLAANHAVQELFGLEPQQPVEGRKIGGYLPVLADALRLDSGSAPFRTSAQSMGRRENGEFFLADTWFSTYLSPRGRRLAAIIIDSSEEMRDREEQNLRQLTLNSRIMAAAMLHEVRNLCSAISAFYANVAADSDRLSELGGLNHLVQGLAQIASLDLDPGALQSSESVPLKDVLNDLRIIVEPAWGELGGATRWELPPELPKVLANRPALLQVFLNLVQNSQRAVKDSQTRELVVSVTSSVEKVSIRFQDSGPGVTDPRKLFQPFQSGADSTGLGLYISRSLLRRHGGEVRFEAAAVGACFIVELVRVTARAN